VVEEIVAQHVAGAKVHGDGLKAGLLDGLGKGDLEFVVGLLQVERGVAGQDLVVGFPGVEQPVAFDGGAIGLQV
jgi:hypothetical protein